MKNTIFCLLISFILLQISCSKGQGNILSMGNENSAEITNKPEIDAAKTHKKAQEALEFCKKNKFNTDYAILIDMSLHSGVKRLFVYDFNENKIIQKLQPLQDVGLGYVQLGQSSSTLSGGEAQRIKLASFLVKGATKEKALFVFDEPTTGLHFHDIKKLLASFNALIEKGHSILVIEHNLDLIKCADWIIDLGPEGGENGGKVLAVGTPEEVVKDKNSVTAKYLKEKL